MSRCRSVVAVLSPAQYTPPQLLAALSQLSALSVPPVVVLLQVRISRGVEALELLLRYLINTLTVALRTCRS